MKGIDVWVCDLLRAASRAFLKGLRDGFGRVGAYGLGGFGFGGLEVSRFKVQGFRV